MTAAPAESDVSERAKAIARGLISNGRAAVGSRLIHGMLQLACRNGGYYWISLDRRQGLKGRGPLDSVELQPSFAAAMERAGR
jgi:hypothetical protein